MNLGETIYKLRTERNLSQGELADLLNISRQSISKWENNNAVPDLEKMIKLSEIFQVSIDEIVKGKTSVKEKKLEEKKGLPIKKVCAAFFLMIAFLAFLFYPFVDSRLEQFIFVIPIFLWGILILFTKNNIGLWSIWSICFTVDIFLRYYYNLKWTEKLYIGESLYEVDSFIRTLLMIEAIVLFFLSLITIWILMKRKSKLTNDRRKFVFIIWGLFIIGKLIMSLLPYFDIYTLSIYIPTYRVYEFLCFVGDWYCIGVFILAGALTGRYLKGMKKDGTEKVKAKEDIVEEIFCRITAMRWKIVIFCLGTMFGLMTFASLFLGNPFTHKQNVLFTTVWVNGWMIENQFLFFSICITTIAVTIVWELKEVYCTFKPLKDIIMQECNPLKLLEITQKAVIHSCDNEFAKKLALPQFEQLHVEALNALGNHEEAMLYLKEQWRSARKKAYELLLLQVEMNLVVLQKDKERYNMLYKTAPIRLRNDKRIQIQYCIMNKDYKEAIKILDFIKCKSLAQRVQIMYFYAKCYYEMKDFSSAEKYIEYVVENGNSLIYQKMAIEMKGN